MVTESFLNTCFSVILGTSKIKKDKVLYRDIINIFSFYNDKSTDVPLAIKSKVECLLRFCELKLQDKSDDNVIDSLSLSEKFKDLIEYLDSKRIDISDNTIQDNIKQIRLRKKLNSLLSNHTFMTEFLDSVKEGTFDSIDNVIDDYDVLVKGMYSNLMDASRGESIEASSSLDMVKDDFTSVVNMIKKKFERKNTTSTGFPIIDNDILKGGFERSRLYVFAGGSSSGKSTLLCNFIINSATKPPTLFETREIDLTKKRVYVYITLENTIEESLLRFYQCMFEKTDVQILQEITSAPDEETAVKNIKDKVLKELDKTNSTIIMKYFPAMSISSVDIMSVLDDVTGEYGEDSIKGLYVDYLDLLKTDTKYDLLRIELGHITLSLKTLAVGYNIPVITATQLGRSAYRIEKSSDLNLDQVGESIKKVEHSDFIALLTKDPVDDKTVHMKIGKNRSGKNNVALDFNVNFSFYKFINGHFVSNDKRVEKDVKNDKIEQFDNLLGF